MGHSRTGQGMPRSDSRVKKGFPQGQFEPRREGCLVRDERKGWRIEQGLVPDGISGFEDEGSGEGDSHLPGLEDWENGGHPRWGKREEQV